MATFSNFLGVWRAAGDLGGTAGYAGVPWGGFGEGLGGGLGDFEEAWEARARPPAARAPAPAIPPARRFCGEDPAGLRGEEPRGGGGGRGEGRGRGGGRKEEEEEEEEEGLIR